MDEGSGRGRSVGPKWLRDDSGGSTSGTVKRQERRAAKLIASDGGARRRRGSGSNPLAKGDAVSWKHLAECKQTANKQFTIKASVLAKIEAEATDAGLSPFLHVEFLSKGSTRFTRDMSVRWVMIPEHVFHELVEAANRAAEEEP